MTNVGRMNYSYSEYVRTYLKNYNKIKIDQSVVDRIQRLSVEIVEAKYCERHHLTDNQNEIKRFTTGYLGEAAIEQLLGINIIDWTIGDSTIYHKPDIPGYNIGVKTVDCGKFPIIFKKNYYPQIICIKSKVKANTIFICGLAKAEILNKYQDDDLILDANLRARGTKTGFYGFKYLNQTHLIKDIYKYMK